MWFKYFNKEDWNLRMWKNYNLKLEANVYGSSRNMFMAQWQSLLFKIFRGEGVMRLFFSATLFSGIMIYSQLTKDSRARKAVEEELKQKAETEQEVQRYLKEQKLNRYQKPTMLLGSMEAFMNHIGNSAAINDALEFSSNEYATLLQDDHAKGLDSWLPKYDRELIQFAKEGAGKKDHH